MKLLKKMFIHSPSGNELNIRNFLIKYINDNISDFKVRPTIIKDGIQDCLILKFGILKQQFSLI